MTHFKQMKQECKDAGYVQRDAEGIEVCALAKKTKCSGHSCPSKAYWAQSHRQTGYHYLKALERTGLIDDYNDEMS